MGIIKEYKQDFEYTTLWYKVIHSLSPIRWYRLIKARRQRAERGWADKDAVDLGNYVAKITKDMLTYLNNYGHADWELWLKQNSGKKGHKSYKNLNEIINDIDAYLKFSQTSFADDIDLVFHDISTDSSDSLPSHTWKSKETGKELDRKEIDKLIKKHQKEEKRLEQKAADAMKFFGSNFPIFWD